LLSLDLLSLALKNIVGPFVGREAIAPPPHGSATGSGRVAAGERLDLSVFKYCDHVQTSNFLSATLMSRRQPIHTADNCRAWRRHGRMEVVLFCLLAKCLVISTIMHN